MIFAIRNDGINSGKHSPRLSGLVIRFFRQELLTQRAGADKMGQQAKVPCLVTDATGNDGRMNAEALRQFHDSQRRWLVLYLARTAFSFLFKPSLTEIVVR